MSRGPVQFKPPKAVAPESFSFPNGYAGGMNAMAMPDQIADNETPDVMNMTLESGVWVKRTGLSRINTESWGEKPIRGLYEFWKEGAANPIILVAWDKKLYSLNLTNGAKTDLMTGAKASIADTNVTFFTMNDKCYFLTGSEFCEYDGTNPVAEVVGYVPTIIKSRSPNGTTVAGTPYEELNYLSNSWEESFSGTAEADEYILSMEADSIERAWVNGEELAAGFALGEDGVTVTFDTAPGDGDNNVIIQATKNEMNDPDDITKCTIAHIWGGSNDTRVFLAGNSDVSNRRWYSGLADPTYWPLLNYDDVGSNAEAIKGFGRLYDMQIIYKERSTYYSTVYGPDATTGLISYPVLPMNDQYGCIAPRTVAPAQNGLLALSEQGVTYTMASFVRGQLNVIVASNKINSTPASKGINNFTMAQRQAAHAFIYDQKYWLHIGDQVWILDLKYSSLPDGIFCWYPYSGTLGKASGFMESRERLYLGDDSAGLVYLMANSSSPTPYQDDGEAIDAYWTSPMVFGKARDWIKDFKKLNITYGGQAIANHLLSLISEDGDEEILVSYSDNRAFNYDEIDFDNWTYGDVSYPATSPEKVSYRGEYFQWKIRNNQKDEPLAILAQVLLFTYKKSVR
jgi:hypothetical protein